MPALQLAGTTLLVTSASRDCGRTTNGKVQLGTWRIGLQVVSCLDREAACWGTGTYR